MIRAMTEPCLTFTELKGSRDPRSPQEDLDKLCHFLLSAG